MRVEDGGLYHNDVRIAGGEEILVYRTEFKDLTEGVTRLTTPGNIDLIFVAGPRVVTVESKKPEDLYGSFKSRRLARQVRTMMELGDTPVIMIRGLVPAVFTVPVFDYVGNVVRKNGRAVMQSIPSIQCTDLWDELVRLQALGVYVVQGPLVDEAIPSWVERMRQIFAGADILRAVAGTDKKESHERKPGWLLRRIPGIGMKKSTEMHAKAGSTGRVLRSPRKYASAGDAKKIMEAQV